MRLLLFVAVIVGDSACSAGDSEVQFGEELEVAQSACKPNTELRSRGGSYDFEAEEEAVIVDNADGVSLQASLRFNCAVGEICAESKTDEGTSSLDVLFYPCVVENNAFANCMCMIDVQSPVNVEGVSSIRVFKQALGRPSEPIERDIIAEIEIGPE